jgi:hypothetical protein
VLKMSGIRRGEATSTSVPEELKRQAGRDEVFVPRRGSVCRRGAEARANIGRRGQGMCRAKNRHLLVRAPVYGSFLDGREVSEYDIDSFVRGLEETSWQCRSEFAEEERCERA